MIISFQQETNKDNKLYVWRFLCSIIGQKIKKNSSGREERVSREANTMSSKKKIRQNLPSISSFLFTAVTIVVYRKLNYICLLSAVYIDVQLTIEVTFQFNTHVFRKYQPLHSILLKISPDIWTKINVSFKKYTNKPSLLFGLSNYLSKYYLYS